MSLETIVQNMVTAKEPEANIAKVIRHYNQINSSPLNQIEEVEIALGAEETPECEGEGMVWSEADQKCIPQGINQENKRKINPFVAEEEIQTENQKDSLPNQQKINRSVSDEEYETVIEDWEKASKPNMMSASTMGLDPTADDPRAQIPEDRLAAYDAWALGKSEEEIKKLLPPAVKLGFDPNRPYVGIGSAAVDTAFSVVPGMAAGQLLPNKFKENLEDVGKILWDAANVDAPLLEKKFDRVAKGMLEDLIGPELTDAYYREDEKQSGLTNTFFTDKQITIGKAIKDLILDEGYSYRDPETQKLVTKESDPKRFEELQKDEHKIQKWEEDSTEDKRLYTKFYGAQPKYLKQGIKRISDESGKVVGTEKLPDWKKDLEEIEGLEAKRKYIGPALLDSRKHNIIPGIANAIKTVGMSYIPQVGVGLLTTAVTKNPAAGLTASTGMMASQMGPDMILSFNEEKAKRLYPTLSKTEGMLRLKEEGKWETTRPISLLPLALYFERIGYKKVSQAIAKNPFSARGTVSALWAGMTESATEIAQLPIDLLNIANGKGLKGMERAEFVFRNFVDQAPEVAAQAFVGTFFLGKGGQMMGKAYKEVRDHTVPHAEGLVSNSMINLGNLKQQKELATDPKVKKGIDYQIKGTKDYIIEELRRGNDLGNKLTDNQIKSISNAAAGIESSELAIGELQAQSNAASALENEENTNNKLLSIGQIKKNEAAITGYQNKINEYNKIIDNIVAKLPEQETIRSSSGRVFSDLGEAKSVKKDISNQYIEDKKRLTAQNKSGEISDKQFKADSASLKSQYDTQIKEINDSTSIINKTDKNISESNILASENTQKLFDNFLKDKEITKDKDGKFIFSNKAITALKKSQEGLVNKVTNSMFGAVPNSMIVGDKNKAKSLFKANVDNALFELLRGYKPSTGVPLAAWLQKNLPKRAKRGFKGITNDKYFQDLESSAVQGMIAEEDSSVDPYMSNIDTAAELGIQPEMMNEIKKVAKKALLTSKEKVDNIKFKSDIAKSFTNDLYDGIKKGLNLKNTKTNQGLTQAMEDKPETFYNTLSIESMRKARGKDENGKSINPFEVAGLLKRENGVLQKRKWTPAIGKKFIKYITDPDIGKNTRSDRQMSLIEALATSMGAREAISLLENDIEFRERFAKQQLQDQNKEIAQKAAEKIDPLLKILTPEQQELLIETGKRATNSGNIHKILGISQITIDSNRDIKTVQKQILDFVKKFRIPSWLLEMSQLQNFGAVRTKLEKNNSDSRKLKAYLEKNNLKANPKDYYYALTDGRWVPATKKINKQNGEDLYTIPIEFIDEILPKKGGAYNGKKSKAWLTVHAAAKENDKYYKTPTLKRVAIPTKIKRDERAIEKFLEENQYRFKENQEATDLIMEIFDTAVNKGMPNIDSNGNKIDDTKIYAPIELASLFITSALQASGGWIKISAPIKYIVDKFKHGTISPFNRGIKSVEEHTPTAKDAGLSLVVMLHLNKVKELKPLWNKAFFQALISKFDDQLIFVAKLNKSLPPGKHFFSPNVGALRYMLAGMDLNALSNVITKESMASELNISSPNTIDGVAASNAAGEANSADQVENLIDRVIAKLTEMLGTKGTLQMNIGAIPINLVVGALRAVKLAYQGGKTLAQAIEKGYSTMKDYMSAQEWADFVSKSTQEVRNEKNPAQVKLAILSEKGVAQIQEQSRKTDEALLKEFGIEIDGLSTDEIVEKLNTLRKAKSEASNTKNPTKKARVFDFDDTLAKTNSKVGYTLPDGTSGNLDATQFAEQYDSLKEAGATFDYSEFNKVKKGSKGPLANLAKRFTEALGDRDVFVLTARPAESAQAIQEFLRSTLGISIPLKNISGLENGTPGAKALWIAEKVSEKYNDIFFADDSKANVDAVKKMLTDLGVTNKVQQAKEDGKKTLEDEMDSLIRTNKPSKIGRILNKLNIYIPPGADDFAGLLSYFVGSGKKGEQQQKWFHDNLLDPFGKGINAWTSAKVSLANDYKALKKRFKNKKLLAEKVLGGLYTKEQAVRAYLYNKAGQDLGLNKADTQDLIDLVEGNADLKAFADELSKITKLENGYPNITQEWLGGNIGTDMANVANTALRQMFLQDFVNNKNQIFTDQNLKLIKQAYGNDFTNALENILERMTTGINRKKGKDKEFNTVMNWINQSVGAVMAVNMRSAVLQQLSIVNYTNWSFNNPFMMAKAMANVPQFLKDYVKIWNSPFLKERRGGMTIDINMNDIADSNPGNLFLRMNKKILELGFKPTQWGDSNAISFGGAMWYRNKVNRLIKEGMSKEDAEAQAMLELRELSEEHQQSSRPDRISRQQSSDIGRLILAFANTPLQLARSTKKAIGNLIYRRGDPATNMSKAIYYGFAQSLVFVALQQGLFSLFADDDEEIDEKEQKKLGYAIHSVIDGLLRGVGFAGATIAALKNLGMEYASQYEKRKAGKYVRDGSLRLIQKGLTISPPVSKKIGDIVEAQKFETWRQYKHDPFYQGFAVANYVSGLTNIPADRVFKKIENLKAASDDKTEAWQSIFLALGWSPYNVDVQWPERPPKKKKKKTPLNVLQSGVLGKANRDGTIEVAPGLSPEKRKEVVDHEKRHQKEMKSGKLDYDNNFVYYGKKKFTRKNGKIAHAGKWKPEGDHSLPWEKFAHNVNNKTT